MRSPPQLNTIKDEHMSNSKPLKPRLIQAICPHCRRTCPLDRKISAQALSGEILACPACRKPMRLDDAAFSNKLTTRSLSSIKALGGTCLALLIPIVLFVREATIIRFAGYFFAMVILWGSTSLTRFLLNLKPPAIKFAIPPTSND